jgi:hypothetical protein
MEVGGELHARTTFTPEETILYEYIRCVGGCVGTRVGPDVMEKRKIFYLYW